MDETIAETELTATPAKGKALKVQGPDLSAEIAQVVAKLPGDKVRCRRVSRSMYRVNWVAPQRDSSRTGLTSLETWHIRDSKFMRAEKVDGQLVVEDITAWNN